MLKEEANGEFREFRIDNALRLYKEAINLCPPGEATDIAIFHNNRGMCFLKIVIILKHN